MSKYTEQERQSFSISFMTNLSRDVILTLTENPWTVFLSLPTFEELLLPSCLEAEFSKLIDNIRGMRAMELSTLNEEETILVAWIHSIARHCLLDPDILYTILQRIKMEGMSLQKLGREDYIFVDLYSMKELLISALSHPGCESNSCVVISAMTDFHEWIKKCRISTVERCDEKEITVEMKDNWTALLDNLFVPDTSRI